MRKTVDGVVLPYVNNYVYFQFFQSYDDNNVGDLSQLDIEGVLPIDDVNQVEGMKTMLGIKYIKK